MVLICIYFNSVWFSGLELVQLNSVPVIFMSLIKLRELCGHELSGGLFCCCSVFKLCLPVFDPMDCCMPGFPVLDYLPGFAHTHDH